MATLTREQARQFAMALEEGRRKRLEKVKKQKELIEQSNNVIPIKKK